MKTQRKQSSSSLLTTITFAVVSTIGLLTNIKLLDTPAPAGLLDALLFGLVGTAVLQFIVFLLREKTQL